MKNKSLFIIASILICLPSFSQGTAGCRMTKFDPLVHGFKFVNSFANWRFEGPITIGAGGRCAGMVYAAMDYYRNGKPIPTTTSLPPEGSVLGNYISYRQSMEHSLFPYIDKYVELNFNPFGSRNLEFFNWGLQGYGGGRLEELKRSIDAGNPVPITLFNPYDVYNHHVVLAIGYCMGRYLGDLKNFKEDLRIQVYDPNHPNVIKTLKPDVAHSLYRYEGGTYDNNKANEEEWRTYFLHNKYTPLNPSNGLGASICVNRRNLEGVNNRGKTLPRLDYRCVNAKRADFYGATVMQSDFCNALLQNATFYGANFRNSNFSSATVTDANFYGADLKSTWFYFTDCQRANFTGADMALAELSSVNFSNAILERTSLHQAKMQNANFSNAHCAGANFTNSFCNGANFRGADLQHADFRNADISDANFTGANITGADFSGAIKVRTIGLPR